MKDRIADRIEELQSEWTLMGNLRSDLEQQTADIDNRLSQISGALVELTTLLKEDQSSIIQDTSS